MAYNPYSAVNAIYNYKGEWESANQAGDAAKKNEAAKKAQEYYKQLRSNGYSSTADALEASSYTQAKSIRDKLAKTDKTPTRKYLYSLGQKYGMSNSDVDSLIGWDNDTGQVTFGGKVVGTPDAEVDGVSYWSDTGALDDAFDDYISRSGTTRSKTNFVNQGNESLYQKYNQEYDDLKNTNPFETEEAKAILAKYDLAGLQGRDNAVASSAGTNGGNIDSYAAANAMRQQAALVSQGQTAVLEAYQQKLDHARNLLSDMGVHIDRVYNQDETSKNNDVSRKSEIASVTGYSPDEWVASTNPYMNDDGTLKEEYKDIDFSEIMAKAKAAGNTEAYNAAAQARFYKIMGNYGKYGQYDDGNYIVPTKQKTETAKEFDDTMAYNYALTEAEKEQNAANNQNAIDQILVSKLGTRESASTEDAGQNAGQDASTASSGNTANAGSSAEPLSESAVEAWVAYLNQDILNYGKGKKAITTVGDNQYRSVDTDYVIVKILEADNLTQAQKDYLLYNKFGITGEQVDETLRYHDFNLNSALGLGGK